MSLPKKDIGIRAKLAMIVVAWRWEYVGGLIQRLVFPGRGMGLIAALLALG